MRSLKKILIVDDDADLREALAYQILLLEEFTVHEAEDGTSALNQVNDLLFDLVILDVGLPDIDGRELCKLMKQRNVKCPIVMLTAQDTDADTISVSYTHLTLPTN